MGLPNNYGRTKLTSRYKSVFDFVHNYIIPNKNILGDFKALELAALKEYNKAANRVKFQTDKVNSAYEKLIEFKR